MSDLEKDNMRIISDIYTNKKNTITSEEQLSLAKWAAKTAIMMQYIDKDPLVPECRRKWLFNHHTPPPDTCIWVARYNGSGIATALTKNLFVGDNPKDLSSPNGQVVFFSIGTLLFGVLSLYFKLKSVGVRTVFPERLAAHLLQIWPIDSQLLMWPIQGFDDSLRLEFSNSDWGEILRFGLLNPAT